MKFINPPKNTPLNYYITTTGNAGKLTLVFGRLAVHILPRKKHRKWGYKTDQFEDIDMFDIGVGPVVLVCWYNVTS